MKLHHDITINGKLHKKGERISSWLIFPFFIFHMLMFGGSGFAMAYFSDSVDLFFLYMHGGIAITVYMGFYLAIFGVDAVKWMLINALIGIFGIYSELRIILNFFDKDIADYSFFVHVIPFAYYVLYTFLLYRAVLSFSAADDNPQRKKNVDIIYIVLSMSIYLTLFFSY